MGNLTVKESGEMVNIISPNVNNITSFKVHFSPKQEGTGDPSPENVREIVGWNGVEGYISNVAQSYSSTSNTLTAAIDWTEDVGTIYGGYVDLITGEIYKKYEQVIFNGTIRWNGITNYDDTNRFIYSKGFLPLPSQNNAICYFNYLTNKLGGGQIGNGFIGSTGNVLIYTDKNINSIDSLMEYQTNNPLQLIYELETPVLVATLSPTQLSTLKGQNNFWSNADYVEIEYELTETFDIQKAKRKIILNQPHVESASGTIAKPETDMIGKIKECKIHFMPVQQSDSDPTPDNIVPVTGWTGIDVYQAFVEYPITPIVNTTEGYGVKWVVDKDGLMTAYGTPTAFTGATLGTIDVNGDETLYATVAGSLNNVVFNKPTLLNSSGKNVVYTAGDAILQTGLDLSLYSDIKKVRVSIKRSGNVFMSGSCNAIVWKDKKPTVSTMSIDWTNEAGTIYGGYVDLVSGELVQNYYCYQMTGTESFTNSGSNWVVSYIPTAGMQANPSMKGFCSHYPYSPYTKNKIGVMYNERTITFDQSIGDAAYWKNFCMEQYNNGTPVTLVYEINTSITYQLTPQQLTTLRGINNIWSSANGEVEIKYWKH